MESREVRFTVRLRTTITIATANRLAHVASFTSAADCVPQKFHVMASWSTRRKKDPCNGSGKAERDPDKAVSDRGR